MAVRCLMNTDHSRREIFYGERSLLLQLLQGGQLQAAAEHGDGLLQLLHRGQRGGDTDVAVLGVFAIGEGGSGPGHHHADLLAQLQGALGQTGLGVQGDEVAAGGPVPLGDAQGRDLGVQGGQNGLELRLEDGGVALHQGQGVLPVLQETHVPQLVYLIKADDLDIQQLLHILHVGGAAGKTGHTGARHGDFRGRGKLEGHIPVAVLFAQTENVGEGDEGAVELMDAVGIVPHEQEVGGGGLHGRQPADSFL